MWEPRPGDVIEAIRPGVLPPMARALIMSVHRDALHVSALVLVQGGPLKTVLIRGGRMSSYWMFELVFRST